MNKNGRRVLSLTLLLICLLVNINYSASAQTVVNRVRLGSSVEGIAYIPNGPFANHIAVVDGMDLIVSPADSKGVGSWKKLFSFTSVGMTAAPRGIGYVDTEKLLVVAEWPPQNAPATFRFMDNKGEVVDTVVFEWPADAAEANYYVEGVVWVPLNATRYAGNILFLAKQRSVAALPTLFVMTRKGAYVDRIVLPDWFDPTGLAYRAPGRLLLGNSDNSLWEMDLNGNFLRDPAVFNTMDIEGVAVLPGNKVAITSHALGKLLFLDENLAPTGRERSFQSGLGLNGLLGSVAWKSDTEEFLVHAADNDSFIGYAKIAAVTADLTSARTAVSLVPYTADPEWMTLSSLEYIAKDGLIVIAKRNPGEKDLFLFDWSGAVSTVYLGSTPTDRVAGLAYLSATDQFAIRRIGVTQAFDVLDRTGGYVRTVDMSGFIGSDTLLDIAYVPNGGNGELMVLTTQGLGRQCMRLDLDGNFIESYSLGFLGTTAFGSLKAITTGPQAGNFVTVDSNSSDLLVFTLP